MHTPSTAVAWTTLALCYKEMKEWETRDQPQIDYFHIWLSYSATKTNLANSNRSCMQATKDSLTREWQLMFSTDSFKESNVASTFRPHVFPPLLLFYCQCNQCTSSNTIKSYILCICILTSNSKVSHLYPMKLQA
jgi:hypothetical protein